MSLTLPYDVRYTHHCPHCNALDTEWHPARLWGRCHAPGCGKDWRMTRPHPNFRQTPRDFDLTDDLMFAQRKGMTYQAAFAAYERMDIPGVTPERFDAAWKRAKELSG